MAPLRRSSRGAYTPITPWLHYAGHSLAPICRSSSGSNTAVTDKRRTAKLEQAAHRVENRLDIIILSGMSTGDSKTVRAAFGDKVLDRRADEDEDNFIERAKAAALAATEQRPCMLVLFSDEVSE